LLISLAVENNVDQSTVLQLLETIPTWMFLRWTPQLLAILDSSAFFISSAIVRKIALAYPESLRYPLAVIRSDLLSSSNSVSSFLNELNSLLYDESTEYFVECIQDLEFPEMKLRNWKEVACDFIIQGDIQGLISSFLDVVKSCEQRSESVYKDFGLKLIALKKAFGSDGNILKKIASSKDVRKFDDLFSSLKISTSGLLHGKLALTDFSLKLASFASSPHSGKVEMPGKFSGTSKPDANPRNFIIGFDATVVVMPSLRRPKRIQIRGSDEQDYFWLVKTGEDLRLDQRIEQLFGVMNTAFLEKFASTEHHLTTYDVVPLTSRVGMIEWLQDTNSLRSVLIQAFNRFKLNADHLRILGAKFGEFCMSKMPKSAKKSLSTSDVYKNLYKKVPDSEVETNLAMLESSIPKQLIRAALFMHSASPESFVVIRASFGSSLATFNASSYILGIGDRHLDNFLFDTSSGKVIGIDFGMSFGQGIYLPVPELMPFRMSNQLASVFFPIEGARIYEKKMTRALEALRSSKAIILNVLQIFVNEPHLDWRKQAEKSVESGSQLKQDSKESFGSFEMIGMSPTDSKQASWYKSKIETAVKKLLGLPSHHIMFDEVLQSPHAEDPGFINSIRRVLLENEKTKRFSFSANQVLSPQDQARCLLDHASDRSILGRTWQGWAPFV